ncbi:DUF4442 domain-containing protein [Streptomyces sp. SID3343]|uniref:DUF4442 domain-containing protein n=1 Tax=Streptomyces sp. SID3343 TaxID=2690260 RepID=UPI00136CBDF7|nr:DUF4442 domain-containing protein [Streptomyces sp. SID3343]MYW03230.1 DUF4442 domain-containing protein [Streptomyces sp. SID3343]
MTESPQIAAPETAAPETASTIDFDAVAEGLRASVPFVRTLGLEFLELAADRAVLRLPDDPAHHNHIAAPHAGAMFTLAESASGAIVIAAFGNRLHRATPLAVDAGIRYVKIARGPITAEARLERPAAEVVAELDEGKRPVFTVSVTLRDEAGDTTAETTVTWTLRPNRAQ